MNIIIFDVSIYFTEKNNTSTMQIALIHFAPSHKSPENNLSELLRLNRIAAEKGASIILNTEMAVTGYSFNSRDDISPYVETSDGKTIRAMRTLADDLNVYIGIAFAERDPETDIFYNSAFLIDPKGHIISEYRKILTERRWARPGNPQQKGFADTPWGRIGTAICADSYNGLQIRAMALKGVDLLWVPANWPETGGLDPITIWRSRAIENGIYVASCNRTGKDLTMDCTKSFSCVFNPRGKDIFKGSSETSEVFLVNIPLDQNGKWAGIRRPDRLAKRKINHFRSVYLRPWMENLTAYYGLPETGNLHIICYVPKTGHVNPDELQLDIERYPHKDISLWVLPQALKSDIEINMLIAFSERYYIGFAASFKDRNQSISRLLITPDGLHNFEKIADERPETFECPYNILHFGPAAIAMVPAEELVNPELSVTLSKLGTDMVIVSEKNMTEEDFLLCRVKALDCMAVAACAANGAQITDIQDMHFNWEKRDHNHPGVLEYTLNTSKTRKKTFYEDVDYDLLLSPK